MRICLAFRVILRLHSLATGAADRSGAGGALPTALQAGAAAVLGLHRMNDLQYTPQVSAAQAWTWSIVTLENGTLLAQSISAGGEGQSDVFAPFEEETEERGHIISIFTVLAAC